ncbi:MAG: hypothetical protein ABF679_09060 [Lentilactobacillus diolivorans]|uniref:hypothetical protein n=1 Tax=Lactobacillaceae TaxID=33958 RepID=UPI0021C40106|nr:hypothetical protein [Liquorilactobacillus satsumensis]MCP9358517.1 hypothetical protein [Liquorilactobacillus satsumensis]MCP9372499.1 hypothetical protein [Liquorilactobacillus satsumensis]
MFKKGKIFIGVAVALLAIISLSACGKSANDSSDGDVGQIQKLLVTFYYYVRIII